MEKSFAFDKHVSCALGARHAFTDFVGAGFAFAQRSSSALSVETSAKKRQAGRERPLAFKNACEMPAARRTAMRRPRPGKETSSFFSQNHARGRTLCGRDRVRFFAHGGVLS